MTDRYDEVYLRWRREDELVAVVRQEINSRPVDDPAAILRLTRHGDRASALRREPADIVVARQHCRARTATSDSVPLNGQIGAVAEVLARSHTSPATL